MRLLKLSLYCLASKCAGNNEVLSADQGSLPPLSTKGDKRDLAPKTYVLTVDHHFRGFGAFVKSDMLCSVNTRSASS